MGRKRTRVVRNVRNSDLLDETWRAIASRIQSGERFPFLGEIRWHPDRAGRVSDGLHTWLRKGSPAALARLLKTHPEALAHPAVLQFLSRLRRIAHQAEMEAEGMAVWLDIDATESLPDGICSNANGTLRRLAEAVVSGVFQEPGWRIQPPANRGRPHRRLTELVDAHETLAEYEMVLEFLRDRQKEFKKRKGELQASWDSRLSNLIRQAWRESGIGTEQVPVKPVPNAVSRPVELDPLHGWDDSVPATMERPIPLPSKIVEDLVAHRPPTLAQIAYSLVGQRRKLAPRTIRHNAEIARK